MGSTEVSQKGMHGMREERAQYDDNAAPQVSTALSRKSFMRFANYITSELGIKMPETKMTLVQSRLMRRARELQLGSIDEYGEYFFASSNDGEREYFINAITTNKTDFFREPEHFDYLVRTALPNLRAGVDPRMSRLNVWSAACSSGEEPYTLAMILSEYALNNAGLNFAILGTDISTKVLDLARKAMYEESLTTPVPAVLRHKYLLRSKDRSSGLVRVSPALREKVSFHQLNFMSHSYRLQDMFDIVFCRNVLIYFDRKTQESVICKICRNINPGGYLFVGHSESLAGMDVPVRQVNTAVFRMPMPGKKR
jgi:chemotaxis protein methyltransferase CheR